MQPTGPRLTLGLNRGKTMSAVTLHSKHWLLAFVLSAILAPAWGNEPKKADADKLPPPEQLTAQQDHKRMMELLHIEKLRPGANPNNKNAPNAVNYDEAKANPYPKLPDPLRLKDGTKVTTPEMWWKRRRP